MDRCKWSIEKSMFWEIMNLKVPKKHNNVSKTYKPSLYWTSQGFQYYLNILD